MDEEKKENAKAVVIVQGHLMDPVRLRIYTLIRIEKKNDD